MYFYIFLLMNQVCLSYTVRESLMAQSYLSITFSFLSKEVYPKVRRHKPTPVDLARQQISLHVVVQTCLIHS